MQPKQLLSLIVLASFMGALTLPRFALAQSTSLISLVFPPTDDSRDGPARSEGGGHRGPACISPHSTPLLALLPSQTQQAQTVDSTPTLYWYIPPTPAQQAEFVLINSQGDLTYQATIRLPQQSGIMRLTLPKEAALAIDKTYQWTFSLLCDEQEPSRNSYVSGDIKRTTLSSAIQTQLQTADPFKQAQVLAQSKIWYDTLDRVAQVRSQRQEEWVELLTSVGLSAIATEPFQDCCTAQ
ncbi:MAG: DUF928 domain-containing protein [Thermosynechococcaceae cyanobacterium]